MLQSMGSQRVRHNLATKQQITYFSVYSFYLFFTVLKINHFLKSNKHQNFLGVFLYNTNIQVFFFLQRSRCESNEQPYLKTTELFDGLLLVSSLFHFFYITFSDPISFSLCFSISPSFLLFFLKTFPSIIDRKAVCVCVCVCVCVYIYIYKTGK